MLVHGITSSLGELGAGAARCSPSTSRSSPPTCSATARRPSRAATTRSAPTPACVRDVMVALGHEQRDDRRPLARRRRRDAARLPVPRARRAPRAGLQRRARARGQPAAARRDAARLGVRAAAAGLARRCSTPARAVGRCARRALGLRAGLRRRRDGRAASRRWATPRRARRSSTPRARSSTSAASASTRDDRLYLAERRADAASSGASATRSSPPHHGMRAHELMPGSRLEIFAGAGHFPHHDDPVALRRASCATSSPTTEPADAGRRPAARPRPGARRSGVRG